MDLNASDILGLVHSLLSSSAIDSDKFTFILLICWALDVWMRVWFVANLEDITTSILRPDGLLVVVEKWLAIFEASVVPVSVVPSLDAVDGVSIVKSLWSLTTSKRHSLAPLCNS